MSDLLLQPSRRQALKAAITALVTIPLRRFMRQGQAQSIIAQGAFKLSLDDPLA